MIERDDAYKDLGGQPSILDAEHEDAIVAAGLGSDAMRARSAARQKERDHLKEREDAPHYAEIAKVGMANYRDVVRKLDQEKGIDVDSPEYLAKQRRTAEKKKRRYS